MVRSGIFIVPFSPDESLPPRLELEIISTGSSVGYITSLAISTELTKENFSGNKADGASASLHNLAIRIGEDSSYQSVESGLLQKLASEALLYVLNDNLGSTSCRRTPSEDFEECSRELMQTKLLLDARRTAFERIRELAIRLKSQEQIRTTNEATDGQLDQAEFLESGLTTSANIIMGSTSQ
jgi:hypothetical protein